MIFTHLSNNLFDINNYSKREITQIAMYLTNSINLLINKASDNKITKSTNGLLKDFGIITRNQNLNNIKKVIGKTKTENLITSINKLNDINYYKIPELNKFSFNYRINRIHSNSQSRKPTMVDLFCGSGGLSLGMNQAGFKTVFANDIDRSSLRTYLFNRPGLDGHHVIMGDIRKIINNVDDYIPCHVNLVVGGPPCQGFSMANRQRIIDDPRNILYKYFVRSIQKLKPEMFVMENVKGMLKASRQVIEDFNSNVGINYKMSCKIFNAEDFGVPQNRERLIFIGIRKDIADKYNINATDVFLRIINYRSKIEPITVALDGLRPLKASKIKGSTVKGDKRSGHIIELNWSKDNTYMNRVNMGNSCKLVYNHKARYNNNRDIKIYGLMKPGDKSTSTSIAKIMPYKSRNNEFKDKYFKLIPTKPCKTITAHMRFDCNMYVHPYQARGLTPREAARIQSYPDNYLFLGPYTRTYQQIGNSVPPILARIIGNELIKLI